MSYRQDLKQRAVLWRATGSNDDYGEPLLGSAEEIPARWERITKLITNAEGENITITATAQVDTDIPLGSVMWEGKLADVETATGLLEVVGFDKIPDAKGRDPYREASLVRRNDTLPPL